MKDSIAYLPKDKQEELNFLCNGDTSSLTSDGVYYSVWKLCEGQLCSP